MMVDWLDQREHHYDELRQEMRAGFASIDARFASIDARFARLEATMGEKMGEMKAEILKWAMGFWIASLLAIVGALVTLSRISH